MAAASKGPAIVAVATTLIGINAFFIALRCYTRIRISKNFNCNDVFMILAVFVYAGLGALIILAVRNGVGGHTDQATFKKIGNSLKYIFFLEVVYVILTSVMKASLAVTLLQWTRKKVHTWLLYSAIAIDFVACLAVVLYFMLQCQPISYAWELLDSTKKGHCLPFTAQVFVGYALSGVTITLDMLFLVVPFFMLAGRGISKRLKIYIFCIFGLGVVASIANFFRLAALVVLKKSIDPLFDAAPVFLWSTLEVSLGICVAGIVELRPLMQRYKVRGFESPFDQLDEDHRPIRMNSLEKTSFGFSKVTVTESQVSVVRAE